MSSKTRIIVIRKSQLLIAGIILIAAVLLLMLLILASGSSKNEQDNTQPAASDISASSDVSVSNDASAAFDESAASDASAASDISAISDSSAVSDSSTASAALYTPGIYTSTVTLNDTALEVQVIVDENHINSISLTNLDETIETMYPLVSPAMENLSEQIISTQSITGITYSTSNQYTSMVLYEAICEALEKAGL